MKPLPVFYEDEDHCSLFRRMEKYWGVTPYNHFTVEGIFLRGLDYYDHLSLTDLITYARLVTEDEVEQLGIINKHSILSLEQSFRSTETTKSRYQVKMCGRQIATHLTQQDISMRRLSWSPERRFCPECRKEQLAKYGETYSLRNWLPFGVDVCIKHGCSLWVDNNGKLICIPSKPYSDAFVNASTEFLEIGNLSGNATCWKYVMRELIRHYFHGGSKAPMKKLNYHVFQRWPRLNQYRIDPLSVAGSVWMWWKVYFVAKALEPSITMKELVDSVVQYEKKLNLDASNNSN